MPPSGWRSSHDERLPATSVTRCVAEVAGELLGLPLTAGPVDLDEVRHLLAMDKKRDAGGLRMVLLEAVGTPTVTHVDSATVEAALAAVAGA